jgi:hypothetical protein
MERRTTTRGRRDAGDDSRNERGTWIGQRIGWVMMALVVMMGLGGVFGSGPLSRAAIEAPSGLRLEYERFGRVDQPFDLMLDAPARAASDETVRVGIDDRYLDAVAIEEVVPEPETVDLEKGRTVFVFRVARSEGPHRVTFRVTPQSSGWLEGQVGAGEESPLPVRHFIYP